MRSRAGAMVAMFAVISLVWLGSPGVAAADTIVVGGVTYTIVGDTVHTATEALFVGGELIGNCFGSGCPASHNQTIGSPTGGALIEIKEQVVHATNAAGAPFTIYQYNVLNDNVPAVTPIWSLHITTSVIPVGVNSPDAFWSFTSGTEWAWVNSTVGHGINRLCNDPSVCGGVIGNFAAVVSGFDEVTFVPTSFDVAPSNTAFTCGNSELIALRINQPLQCQWVISGPAVVPEPSTMLLLGAGMVGMGFVRRRAAARRRRLTS